MDAAVVAKRTARFGPIGVARAAPGDPTQAPFIGNDNPVISASISEFDWNDVDRRAGSRRINAIIAADAIPAYHRVESRHIFTIGNSMVAISSRRPDGSIVYRVRPLNGVATTLEFASNWEKPVCCRECHNARDDACTVRNALRLGSAFRKEVVLSLRNAP